MKKILLIAFFACFCIKIKAEVTNVLFVGNSITYFNNMPQTFQNIANSLGDTVFIDQHTPGGTGFVNHYTNNSLLTLIKQGKWDYIILQPGSNESPGYSFPISKTLERARIILDSIYKYNPCTKVLYYEISYGVWGNTSANLVTYNNTMMLIRDNLEYLSDSTNLFFAPVGEAFRTSWNNDQSNMLWGGVGDIHPNAKGSYIAACVMYTSIFQKPSFGSNIVNGFTVNEAQLYQNLADTIVLNNLVEWRINTYNQYTDFNFEQMNDSVTFMNLSQNYDSLLWDFGDGSFSTNISPTHIYTTSNEVTVILKTYQHGCSKISKKNIHLVKLGTNTNKIKNVLLFPNPTSHFLNIKIINAENNYTFNIYNSIGRLVLNTTKNKIDISKLPSGLYFLEISSCNNKNNRSTKRYKWVKN